MGIYSEDTATYLWRNGALVPWEEATVHVNAVGHASVAGIFEGLKAYWNADDGQLYLFRMREHYRRFLQSIKMTRFAFDYTLEDLEEATRALMKANAFRRDVYVRPYIFQAGMVRELLQSQPGKPVELVIDSWPFEAYRDPSQALHVCTSSWTRIADNVMPPRLKCFSNYHNGRLAAMEATVSGYDWPVLLDAQGKVTEGPGACLALVRDGAVITPPGTASILESITRDTVGYLVREVLGLPYVERPVDRTELYLADELFFMGTGWEIMPVASVDRLMVGDGAPGSVTDAIREAYAALVRGHDLRRPEWRAAVW